MEANRKINLAVFASGRGSNARNIFQYINESTKFVPSFRLHVSCLITDRLDAGVVDIAREYNIPAHIVPYEGNKKDHEQKIQTILLEYQPSYLLLCGYMRIFSSDFVKSFTREDEKHSRIINIHPSLLPDFPGKDGYGDAFRAEVKESGVTLHFVDEGVDTGPIIKQVKFERYAEDTLETFKTRGLQLEHHIYRELLGELNYSGEIKI